jgi:hypothetical protein
MVLAARSGGHQISGREIVPRLGVERLVESVLPRATPRVMLTVGEGPFGERSHEHQTNLSVLSIDITISDHCGWLYAAYL